MIVRCNTCRNYGICSICEYCEDSNMFDSFSLEEMFQIEADGRLPSDFKVFGEDGQLTAEAQKYYNIIGETYFESMDEFEKYFNKIVKKMKGDLGS